MDAIDEIRQLIEELKQEMMERKPYESVQYNLDETTEAPSSMRSASSGSRGKTVEKLTNDTTNRVMSKVPDSCKGTEAERIVSKEAAAQSNGYIKIS